MGVVLVDAPSHVPLHRAICFLIKHQIEIFRIGVQLVNRLPKVYFSHRHAPKHTHHLSFRSISIPRYIPCNSSTPSALFPCHRPCFSLYHSFMLQLLLSSSHSPHKVTQCGLRQSLGVQSAGNTDKRKFYPSPQSTVTTP